MEWKTKSCSNCCHIGWYKECIYNKICKHYESVPLVGNPFYTNVINPFYTNVIKDKQ